MSDISEFPNLHSTQIEGKKKKKKVNWYIIEASLSGISRNGEWSKGPLNMEKSSMVVVLFLALFLSSFAGGLEARELKNEPMSYQPQNFPGAFGGFPGFGFGQPLRGSIPTIPGFGNLPGIPGGGIGGRQAATP